MWFERDLNVQWIDVPLNVLLCEVFAMNTVLLGLEREIRIRGFLLLFPYSSTSILYRRFFAHLPSGKRKARQVLQRMTEERKMVRRFKYGEYVYHVGKKSSQWFHKYNVTKFHFDIEFNLQKPHQQIIYHKREYEYPFGRADALYYVQLEQGGGGVKFFLEMDDETNKFDKIKKYEQYRESKVWIREFWADPLKRGNISFPMVVVVSRRNIPESNIVKVVHCKPGDDYLEAIING